MKKVRGSGGYIIADLTEEEESQRLGGEYFIGAIGRIDEERISSYHCNICDKDFEGAPIIKFEKPNRDVEGVTLTEEGEYICRECNSIIATYKKFGEVSKMMEEVKDDNQEDAIPLSKFIGMDVFDDKARSLGRVSDIRLKGNKLLLRIDDKDVEWDKIIAINDIVLVKAQSNICSKCNYKNKEGAKFCEECGAPL
ncbi:MAG: hypothetical protein KatS3mg003_2211 [Candidatus Nitrosocaldaceae archaeon]|nr:MAG: hypothetical protein KatS3mg003_2211 [Candidatus Nitrosocaldaceae archaeon]